jgi:hypothetical protein
MNYSLSRNSKSTILAPSNYDAQIMGVKTFMLREGTIKNDLVTQVVLGTYEKLIAGKNCCF